MNLKKSTLQLLCLALVAFFWQGCTSEKNDVPEQPSISLEPGSETLPAFATDGGTSRLTFTATDNWTAMVGEADTRAITWLSVSPTSGQAGTVTLTLNAQPNETPDERNAALTLTCGNARKVITVTQKQQDALTVTSNKVELEAEGGDFSIELQANVSVSYQIEEAAQTWLTPATGTRGLTTSTLHFHAEENADTNPRQGVITLSGGNGLSEQVTVYQAGSSPVLVLTQDEYIVGSEGETIKVELKSNGTYQIEMPSVDWITEADTRAVSSFTHYFIIAPNDTYDNREAFIRFTDTENGLADSVKITQMQQDAIIVAQSIYEIGAEGGALDFPVQANVDFTVSTDADWITRIEGKTKGLIEKTLNFNIETNSTLNSREAIITLTANNGIQQNILVKQSGIIPFLKITSSPARISKELQDITITIESNIDYYFVVEPDVEWIFYRGAYPNQIIDGVFTSTHTFGVDANHTSDTRTGHITFSKEEYNISETITIAQDGEISIAPDIDDIINSEW